MHDWVKLRRTPKYKYQCSRCTAIAYEEQPSANMLVWLDLKERNGMSCEEALAYVVLHA